MPNDHDDGKRWGKIIHIKAQSNTNQNLNDQQTQDDNK